MSKVVFETKTVNKCHTCHFERTMDTGVPNHIFSVSFPPGTDINELQNIINIGRYSEVGEEQNFKCPRCYGSLSCNEIIISKRPQVLLVQVKRFLNSFVNDRVIIHKVNKPVYPCDDMIVNNVNYRLVSICCHKGPR